MWILSGSRQRHPTTTSTLWWHCRCRSASAYSSDNKCALSSQLTPISEGRSPIRHLGRRLVAGSSAPKFRWYIKKFNSPFILHRRVFKTKWNTRQSRVLTWQRRVVTKWTWTDTLQFTRDLIDSWNKSRWWNGNNAHTEGDECVFAKRVVDDSTVLMSHCVVGPVD